MAIWAEIKKAINSNFDKPLNELIENTSQEILSATPAFRKVVSAKNYFLMDIGAAATVLNVSGHGLAHIVANTGYTYLSVLIDGVEVNNADSNYGLGEMTVEFAQSVVITAKKVWNQTNFALSANVLLYE